jgi:1-pyrroline-5-carboxylate dehydrogenase
MSQRHAANHYTGGAHSETAPKNEPVRSYASGSPERQSIRAALAQMESEIAELQLYVSGRQERTTRQLPVVMPHRHRHVLAMAHQAEAEHVRAAIAACRAAAPDWSRTSSTERASIFLKAADLLAGPWRDRLNAATMLGQSKTIHQAEIDSAAELIDFLRFNAHFMERIYREQPISVDGVWNRADYRPLEGFVFAITPFNFTAIAGNLPCAPALMGNTVLWKPAATAALSAHYVMELLQAAGLPPGVINLVHGDAPMIAEIALSEPDLAGVHFTGSTPVFDAILREVSARRYRNYPRIVGETGGKNFILAHASADLDGLATAIVRGAFEYQGQKCSAASRLFIPASRWPALRSMLCDQIAAVKYGDVTDFTNFMGAVIDERAWTRLSNTLASAAADGRTKVVSGARADSSVGYFIAPTLYQTGNMDSPLLRDELFGPIATVVTYEETAFDEVISQIDHMSGYGLTGSIFASERRAINKAMDGLRYAAGNFYVNDKPTGAVVGQQPFGGARASGTNDKAGSMWNLVRWVSPRTIKETFVPATSYAYPFMAPD